MISSDYSEDECARMLRILDIDKIEIKNSITQDAIRAKHPQVKAYDKIWVFFTKGKAIYGKIEFGNTIEYIHDIEMTEQLRRSISIIVSFDFNEKFKAPFFLSKVPNLKKIFLKLNNISPHNNTILLS